MRMSNQEAIGVLESINAKTDYFLINDDARAEAIDMAISALQVQDLQSTCNQLATDTISRQRAIDEVSEGCQEWRGIFERCKEKLLSLPSAQPEPSQVARDIADIIENEKDMRVIARSEITDEQAILHLQASGWMQRHDKEMYESGLRAQLTDDSDSYDALLESAQPEQTRIFVELVVEYPDPELCTYKEYRGKPYYSIKYIENGERYVGFGTYKPEVLSQYLKENFISSTQPDRSCIDQIKWERDTAIQQLNELGYGFGEAIRHDKDVISRKGAINAVCTVLYPDADKMNDAKKVLKEMPSAQPERLKGHWIDTGSGQECSECGEAQYGYDNFRYYCAKCGSDNRGK